MAQQTTVSHLDDIDGSKAAETISFALDGAHFEIDLSAKNAKALRKAFAEFIAAARTIKTSPATPTKGAPSRRTARKATIAAPTAQRTDRSELIAIRAWAAENNVTVAARGRISADVKAQYAAATATSEEQVA